MKTSTSFSSGSKRITDLCCEAAILVFLCYNAAYFGIWHILPSVTGLSSAALHSQYISLFLSILVLCTVFFRMRDLPLRFLCLAVFLLCAILLSCFEPANVPYIKDIFLTTANIRNGFIFPLVFVVGDNPSRRVKQFTIAAYFGLAFNLLAVFCGLMLKGEYMHLGYGSAIWWCFIMQSAFMARTPWRRLFDSAFAAISGILIIFYGNRGVILIFGTMLLYCLLRYTTLLKKITLANLAIASLSLLLFVSASLLKIFSGISSSNTMNSRLLRLFQTGSLTDSAGRQEKYLVCLEWLRRSPLFGYGIGSDRVALAQANNVTDGAYVHNFVFELCMDYGPLLGIILTLLIIGIGIHMLISCRRLEWVTLFAPVYLCTVVKLLLSGSFYYEGAFWGFLLIYFAYIKSAKPVGVHHTLERCRPSLRFC